MDKLTKEQRRKNMQAVKSKGSGIERMLSIALWNKGYRYRKNDTSVPGKPDLTFKKYKVAVFVDGDFWHGKDWNIRKHDHKSNQQFWHNKIEQNIKRDRQVNAELAEKGWTVIRFWGSSIKTNLADCVEQFEGIIDELQTKNGNKENS
jgi:DNA mismatch endonuclease Vsr